MTFIFENTYLARTELIIFTCNVPILAIVPFKRFYEDQVVVREIYSIACPKS